MWHSADSHTPLLLCCQAQSEAGSVLIFSHLCQTPCCCRDSPLPSSSALLPCPETRRHHPGQLTHSVQRSPFVTNCQRLAGQWSVARWGREGGRRGRGIGAGAVGGEVEGVEELPPMGWEPHPTAKPLAMRTHRSKPAKCGCAFSPFAPPSVVAGKPEPLNQVDTLPSCTHGCYQICGCLLHSLHRITARLYLPHIQYHHYLIWFSTGDY